MKIQERPLSPAALYFTDRAGEWIDKLCPFRFLKRLILYYINVFWGEGGGMEIQKKGQDTLLMDH